MRVLGLVGMLAAAAIVLVAMVVVGKGITSATSDGAPKVQTGSDKAYNEMKKDGDLDDPKEEMRSALKDL